MLEIPTINHRDYRAGGRRRRRFVESFEENMRLSGFIVVEGAQINEEAVQFVHRMSRLYYAQSQRTKAMDARPDTGGQVGYTELGQERADVAVGSPVRANQIEFYHWVRNLPANHPFRQLHGVNVQPTGVPAFGMAMEQLYTEVDRFSMAMAPAMSEIMGMHPQALPTMYKDGNSVLRVIQNRPPPGTQPGQVINQGHTDIDDAAILVTDEEEGLEVFFNGRWVPARAGRGRVIYNLGDKGQLRSGGVFQSAWHRRVGNKPCSSIAFFTHPPDLSVLEVLPKFERECDPIWLQRRCLSGWYLYQRLAANGMWDKPNPYANLGSDPALFPSPTPPPGAFAA